MRRLIARRGRKMLRFDSWGSLRGHFFGCLPLGFVRKGSVTRLDGCDCALASSRKVASMSDSRPELRSSVGRFLKFRGGRALRCTSNHSLSHLSNARRGPRVGAGVRRVVRGRLIVKPIIYPPPISLYAPRALGRCRTPTITTIAAGAGARATAENLSLLVVINGLYE